MNYGIYKFSCKEILFNLGVCILVFGLFAFFFYQSWIVFGISILFTPVYFKLQKKKLIEVRRKKLADEFSETLYCVSTNMTAGYSAENAFVDSYKDIVRFYGEKSLMARELIWMKQGLSVNVSIEKLMVELSERSGVEDIRTFSEVFQAAKRNGGNLKDVLIETANTIREKNRIEKEIDVIITEKLFELRVMEVIPFFILMYISASTPGYFEVLYNNFTGILFMTICLAIYIFAIILGKKIVNVKV